MRNLPGIVGALLLCVGLAWILPALGLIAAGALLLVLDRRMS